MGKYIASEWNKEISIVRSTLLGPLALDTDHGRIICMC